MAVALVIVGEAFLSTKEPWIGVPLILLTGAIILAIITNKAIVAYAKSKNQQEETKNGNFHS